MKHLWHWMGSDRFFQLLFVLEGLYFTLIYKQELCWVQYSGLTVIYLFGTWIISLYSLQACRVPDEKLAVSLIGNLLFVLQTF